MKNFKDLGPTFCALPWIHLASNPNGTVKMCCIAKTDLKKDDGTPFSFERDSIEDIFNCTQLRDARKKMLSGEPVADCERCYQEEALGPHSMRVGFNEKWFRQEQELVYRRIEESRLNDYKLKSMPWYYDLRQGNLCNLKCRSCAPENSVAVEKEYTYIADHDQWFAQTFNRPNIAESYRSWFKSEKFNAKLLAEVPNIKKLYFTGGEPTLIESNFKLLEYCIESGHAQHIELMFNTNATNISDRFLEILSKFKWVMLNLSIDGVGKEQEYLRGNARWLTISANLEKLAAANLPNLQLVVNPVIQLCNILTVTKIFDYFASLNAKYKRNVFYFMPIILTDPAHLSMDILPRSIRLEAAKRLAEYLDRTEIPRYDNFFKTRVEQVIAKLQEDGPTNRDLIKTFVNFTILLDRQRKEDFRSVFPELFQLWVNSEHKLNWELE